MEKGYIVSALSLIILQCNSSTIKVDIRVKLLTDVISVHFNVKKQWLHIHLVWGVLGKVFYSQE